MIYRNVEVMNLSFVYFRNYSSIKIGNRKVLQNFIQNRNHSSHFRTFFSVHKLTKIRCTQESFITRNNFFCSSVIYMSFDNIILSDCNN